MTHEQLFRLTESFQQAYASLALETNSAGFDIPNVRGNRPQNDVAFFASGAPSMGGAGQGPQGHRRVPGISTCSVAAHPFDIGEAVHKTNRSTRTMNTNTQVVNIEFHGQPMIAIKNGDEIHVAMKPICEAIGIDWKSQHNRINRHPVMSKGMVVMTTPSDGGNQATATLPLKMLNGWLFGIDAGRVKPESRAKLIEYQTECFDVLANYFMQGEAINPRMQYSVNPGDKLTVEQADTLRQMLTEAAEKSHAGDTKKQGVMIRAGWSKLKSHFKVSYRDIPQSEFTEAVSLLSRHVISGEYLPAAVNAESEPKKITAPVISDYLQAHIQRKAREITLGQYEVVRDIITEGVQSNLNCGASEATAHEYVDSYGDAASGVTVMNTRDVFLLARQTTNLINAAGEALATVHQLEKHLGCELYPRKQHGQFGAFGLPESLVESTISAMQERMAA